MKPFYDSCERNKIPLLEVLRQQFIQSGLVLEIGSGTGQHAVYFSQHLPYLSWQPTEIEELLAGIDAWRSDAGLENVLSPLVINVLQTPWPIQQADYAFSANTAHIMTWPEVEAMFKGIAKVLKSEGRFCLYGPFNYNGHYTSDSNASFDARLRDRDPASGLRDFNDLDRLATECGLNFIKDYEMPANNRTLVWQKN